MPNVVTKKLECIGDDTAQAMRQFASLESFFLGGKSRCGSFNRAWVAIIKDHYKGKFLREFPKGYKDYSEANSVGSRGIYKYYYLEEGNIYEVSEPKSWKRTDRYFCRIEDGQEIRMTEDEVKAHFEAIRNLPAEYVDKETGEIMDEGEFLKWLRRKQ